MLSLVEEYNKKKWLCIFYIDLMKNGNTWPEACFSFGINSQYFEIQIKQNFSIY